MWQSTCKREPGQEASHFVQKVHLDSPIVISRLYEYTEQLFEQIIISIVLETLENDTNTIYDAVYKTSWAVIFWLFLQKLEWSIYKKNSTLQLLI